MTIVQRPLPEISRVSTDGTPGGRTRRIVYVAGAAAILVALALFYKTAAAIVETWSGSETFNHGFLIIPICLYLAWQRRGEVAVIAPAPELRGLLLVVLASCAWLTGHATGTLVVQEFSLVIVLQSIILTMFGWPLCRTLIFPLGYLFFVVPVGEALIPQLQAITALSAVTMLRLVGVSVFSDGNMISIPTGNFYVAEACSGVRYLIGSCAIGVLFAGLIYRSWLRRGLFLAMSLAVPIVANGIRAFGIILIAYLTNNELAVGVDHLIYGWLFFSLCTFLVLGIGMTFRDADTAPAPPPAGFVGRPRSIAAVVLAGILALLPVAAAKTYGDYVAAVPPLRVVMLMAPAVAAPATRLDGAEDRAAPNFAGADAEMHAAYRLAGRTIYLHIGYYQNQRRGASAVSFDHHLIGPGGWILSATGTTSAIVGGSRTAVQYQRFVQENRGRTIWYWYWVDGRMTGNAYFAKLLQAKVKLFGGEQAAAIIEVAADYDDVAAVAEQSLRAFTPTLTGLAPALESAAGR